ncbi:MAG: hypothetical protein GC162_14065 [Planctomycetes bacterium]|nr:hypothetical protein [Planctomycetota bacterium]
MFFVIFVFVVTANNKENGVIIACVGTILLGSILIPVQLIEGTARFKRWDIGVEEHPRIYWMWISLQGVLLVLAPAGYVIWHLFQP